MYFLMSILISALFAYALSNIFAFYIVWLICFCAIFCLLTFLDTVCAKQNKTFLIGCKVISSCDAVVWVLGFLPLYVFLIFGVVGGIITAPVWYFISNSKPKSIKNVISTIIILSLMCLLVYGVILLISPLAAYKLLHYGWVIGLFIAVPIISLIATIIMKSNQLITGKMAAMFTIWSILLIPIMIIGVVTSMSATYHLSTAEDMRAFGNAPTSYDTVFILDNDIDFKGKDVSWFGGQKDFKGVFDGQGFTFFNISAKIECRKMNNFYVEYGFHNIEPEGMGFVRSNLGIIKNLNFEDCFFTIVSKSHGISNYTMHFGILAATNNDGTIMDCKLINCQAKYVAATSDVHVALDIGTKGNGKIENVSVVNQTINQDFYEDDEVEWKKV